MKEYRKNIRVDLKNEYKGTTIDGLEFDGVLEDISTAGLGLWSTYEIESGTNVNIMFKINDETVEINGVLLFKYKKNDKFRYGLKFLDIESKHIYIINRYIRREIVSYLSETDI